MTDDHEGQYCFVVYAPRMFNGIPDYMAEALDEVLGDSWYLRGGASPAMFQRHLEESEVSGVILGGDVPELTDLLSDKMVYDLTQVTRVDDIESEYERFKEWVEDVAHCKMPTGQWRC